MGKIMDSHGMIYNHKIENTSLGNVALAYK